MHDPAAVTCQVGPALSVTGFADGEFLSYGFDVANDFEAVPGVGVTGHGKAAKEQIENYKVIIGFSMPINRIEEWQNISGLNGIVSHKTQLELLSDIDDADRELENVRTDMAAAAEVRVMTEGPDVQAARQDVQVAQAVPKVDAQIQTSLDLIGDRILAAVTRAGAVG